MIYLQYCTPYIQALQLSVVYIFFMDAKVVKAAEEFRFQDNLSHFKGNSSEVLQILRKSAYEPHLLPEQDFLVSFYFSFLKTFSYIILC